MPIALEVIDEANAGLPEDVANQCTPALPTQRWRMESMEKVTDATPLDLSLLTSLRALMSAEDGSFDLTPELCTVLALGRKGDKLLEIGASRNRIVSDTISPSAGAGDGRYVCLRKAAPRRGSTADVVARIPRGPRLAVARIPRGPRLVQNLDVARIPRGPRLAQNLSSLWRNRPYLHSLPDAKELLYLRLLRPSCGGLSIARRRQASGLYLPVGKPPPNSSPRNENYHS